MKRFSISLVLLLLGLFLAVSGVNAGLDRIARSSTQSMVTVYNEKGAVLLVYEGNLSEIKTPAKPSVAMIVHRT